MIPEGLYLLMTLALALGAVRLAKEKVLLNSMKGLRPYRAWMSFVSIRQGPLQSRGMEVTEIRPVKNSPKTWKL